MPIVMEEEEGVTGGEQTEITEPTQAEQEEEQQEEETPRQDDQIGKTSCFRTYISSTKRTLNVAPTVFFWENLVRPHN